MVADIVGEPPMCHPSTAHSQCLGTYEPEAEAAWVAFAQLPEPTLEDLNTLFDRDVAIRIKVEEQYREVDPPDEITNLHDLLVDWPDAMR